MGRLRTVGFELNWGAVNDADPGWETVFSGGAGISNDNLPRSGALNVAAIGTSTSAIYFRTGFGQSSLAVTYYGRVWFRFTSFPSSTVRIMRFDFGGTTVSVRATSGGVLQLWNDVSAAQIGSNSTALSLNTYYRVELSQLLATGAGDAAELRLDGVSVASVTGANLSDTVSATSKLLYGWLDIPTSGADKTIRMDDLAINDSTGATQNSWPGDGKILLLKPVSDNARGANWLDGGGGTTSLFEAVNNTQPTGSGTPANGTQIKNTAKDTTGNYDADLTDYATAGVPSTATVTLVQAVFNTGSNATKAGTTGAEMFVSNPTGPAETAMDFSIAAAAAGSWPSNWRTQWLAAIVGDIASGSRSTKPVIRIGKRVSSTNAAYCAFMGAYVEYVPGSATAIFLDRPLAYERPPRRIARIGY